MDGWTDGWMDRRTDLWTDGWIEGPTDGWMDISLTCHSCFYHIRDLRRIWRYISLSVAKTIATTFITSRLD